MQMKEIITVTRNGEALRISKVTAHGEEVLEADAEARALALLLWLKLSQGNSDGGLPLLPWKMMEREFDRLTRAIEGLTKRMEKHEGAIREFQAVAQTQNKPTPVVGQ